VNKVLEKPTSGDALVAEIRRLLATSDRDEG